MSRFGVQVLSLGGLVCIDLLPSASKRRSPHAAQLNSLSNSCSVSLPFGSPFWGCVCKFFVTAAACMTICTHSYTYTRMDNIV